LIIQKESLQRRDGGNPPSTNQSRGDSAVRSERQFFPDQGESAIRNIDDFWTGDDETKRFVMEKLQAAVAIK
jgi:hypothetical protein